MKRILTVVILSAIMIMGGQTYGQTQYKFGHIDSNELLQIMPEREAAKQELDAYVKQLEDQLATMQAEFERKYQDYMVSAETLSKLIRQTKEAELQEMQQRIQAFSQTAQQEMQAKEGELMQPIIEKARKAIDDVAAENNFTYVFDIGTGVILHWSQDSQDVLPLVKTKLGIL